MLKSRLQIELVDSLAELSKNLLQVNKAIEDLNTSSGELVSETNKLTRRIFWLTVVGVIMTIAGVGIAALQLFGGLK